MQKWKGRPSKLDPDETKTLREIGEKRAAIPSNAELARRYGVTPSTIAQHVRGRIKRYSD